MATQTLESPQSDTGTRTQLIVLGMHRSGTSAMTGVMEALGAYVGDKEELTATSWENPKGFFERQDMRALCDAFLYSLDADWWKISNFDPRNVPQATRDKLAPQVQQLVENLDSHGTWAVKEPRMCLLLPLFEEYLSAPTIIFISRNPLEVAKSLRRRNGFPIDAGLALWEAYNIAALRNSVHLPRVFVNYHQLIDNPTATITSLGNQLEELGVSGLHSELAEEVIEQSLHRELANDDEFNERLTPAQKQLWNALSSGKVDGLPLELSFNSRCILQEFSEDTAQLYGLQRELKETMQASQRNQREFAGAMQKKNAALETLGQKYAIKDRDLREVYSSASWRITAPLRSVSRRMPELAKRGRRVLRAGKRLATRQGHQLLRQRLTLSRHKRLFDKTVRMFNEEWYLAQSTVDKKAIIRSLDYLRASAGERHNPRTMQRLSATWNTAREKQFLQDIEAFYAKRPNHFDAIKTAIIMPTWNRGNSIAKAIDSVLAQTHRAFTLYVIDDGSNDDTQVIVSSYAEKDARIHYHRTGRHGVSSARNMGLQLVNQHDDICYVFYLDSDNRWYSRYLRTMTVFMETGNLDAGYAGIKTLNDAGETGYYRGDDFSWNACRESNYVDLNCFAHRRDAALEAQDWFDTNLKRMVDWDFILRLTALRRTCFAPFLAVDYYDGKNGNRISNTESTDQVDVLTKRVQDKYNPTCFALYDASENRPNWGEIRWMLTQQRIGLKIPAPYNKRMEWGDYHYAESLKAAFEAQGHSVTIDFLGDWEKRPASEDDIVIALRGLTRYQPKPQHFNIMWNISHPDQVSYEEYEEYDLVCVASLSYAAFLRTVIRKPVACLLQCTDTSRFHTGEKDPSLKADMLFVGNSRNEYRDIVRWANEAGADLSVYGTRWDGFIDAKQVKGTNIPNTELAQYYRSADIVLNDHWNSMREFGLVSNRIFDVLASGGSLISDRCYAVEYLFAEAVQQVDNAQEMAEAAHRLLQRDDAEKQALAEHVAKFHSFNARAHTLLHHTYRGLGNHAPSSADDTLLASPYIHRNAPLTVNVLCKGGGYGPQSSAFIRLISPLTHERLTGQVDMRLYCGDVFNDLAPCDVAIVQRTAIESENAAARFMDKLTKDGSRLVVDNDDAFIHIGADHPEFVHYTQKNHTMELLMQQAGQIWFSTANLAQAYKHIERPRHVVENTLDARIWRDYRQDRPLVGQNPVVQMVYMGTSTHDADFDMIMPALDALAKERPNSFELTLISAVRNPPKRNWLRTLQTKENARVYPRFVRWFVQQPHWDVGLSPLVDSPFNRCKSDIKFLDYAGLGVLPVLSDMAAYNGDAKAHGLAVMAENSTEGWLAALTEAVSEIKTHRETVRRAQDFVWSQRSAEQMAVQQWELLQAL